MKLLDAADTAVTHCPQSTDVQQDTNSFGDSHSAPEDSDSCDLEAAFRRGIQFGGVRASLIRANACAFTDRYVVSNPKDPLGQGASGSVHRCVDNLSRTARAVKRIPIPASGDRRLSLQREVSALVTLDHPHIVRLIEYFFEGSELLLVMELLEGPSLGRKMQKIGRFDEELAARCARHMLKAIFCCHCQGITHNDISAENFRFQTSSPGSSLKMVDFGLSERCSAWG
jgi:calcium-dependent protein kinase